MENAKKVYRQPFRGVFLVIARKVGCTPTYVSMVLKGNLGKYADRDTDLVKRIHEIAAEMEKMFQPAETEG